MGTLDRVMRVDYRLNVKHAPSTKYALSIFARSFIKHPSKAAYFIGYKWLGEKATACTSK